MKEAIVAKGPKVTIHDVPIPKPNSDQVLIKVIFSGSNLKDWKIPYFVEPHKTGDDVSGIIEDVGQNVTESKKGDRVAALHEMVVPNGSFAEYAIAWAYTTFHLPKQTSFEEGAAIPLAAMTAAIGLYQRLGLPEPWNSSTTAIPLIVYGASGTVGAYAIKLAQLLNIHPIIAVAGRGQAFVEGLITRSKGDRIVDYRYGDEAVVSAENNSYQNLSQVLAKQGSKITLVLPGIDFKEIPDYIQCRTTHVGSVYMDVAPESELGKAGIKTGGKEFGYVFFRFFGRGLQEGWFTAHPYEVIPGGLNGVEKGLANLKGGVNSGLKYVFRIEDTHESSRI